VFICGFISGRFLTDTWLFSALGTALLILDLGDCLQVNSALTGETHEPGKHVGEFSAQFGLVPAPEASGQLPDLFGEPAKGSINTPPTVFCPIDALNQGLELMNCHWTNYLEPVGEVNRRPGNLTCSLFALTYPCSLA
jgi:hypothetical protein